MIGWVGMAADLPKRYTTKKPNPFQRPVLEFSRFHQPVEGQRPCKSNEGESPLKSDVSIAPVSGFERGLADGKGIRRVEFELFRESNCFAVVHLLTKILIIVAVWNKFRTMASLWKGWNVYIKCLLLVYYIPPIPYLFILFWIVGLPSRHIILGVFANAILPCLSITLHLSAQFKTLISIHGERE